MADEFSQDEEESYEADDDDFYDEDGDDDATDMNVNEKEDGCQRVAYCHFEHVWTRPSAEDRPSENVLGSDERLLEYQTQVYWRVTDLAS